ncbi:DNA repair protein [Bacillus cereus Rock4-18]|nr:DNA repair protein [Bacillus cereus Rock4-18]
MGTAFDYIARLMIARIVINNREGLFTELAAEKGLNKMKRFLGEDNDIIAKLEKVTKKK